MYHLPYPTHLSFAILVAFLFHFSDATGESNTQSSFDQGSMRGSLQAGYSNVTGHIILGGGLGYFVIDHLEVGLHGSAWLFEDPLILQVEPQSTYFLAFHPKWVPYAGAFYRYAYVEGAEDVHSLGGRAGVSVQQGTVALQGGIVYERFLGCDGSDYAADDENHCDRFYPEFGASISF